MSQWQGLTWFKTIRNQPEEPPRNLIVQLVILCTTLAVSATALISYQVVHQLILRNLQQNALLKAQLKGYEIDEWLATRKSEVEVLAKTATVRTMNWSVIEPYLQSEVLRLNDFHHFSLINPDGSYYTTKVGRALANLKDRKHVQQALAGKVYVGDPLISRSTGVIVVPISVPIRSNSPTPQQIIGVMNGSIKINRIAEVVDSLKYGSGSYAFALNSQGEPIAHSQQRLMGNQDYPATSFVQAKDPSLRYITGEMMAKHTDIKRVRIAGKGVYIAYLPLHQVDWSIALVIPRQNIEAQLEALNHLAIVVGVLLTVATIAALRQLLLSQRLRHRVERTALLNRLTGRIRASLDIEQILQTTVEEVVNLLHLERAAYVVIDSHPPVLEIQQEYCREGLPQQVGRFHVSAIGDLDQQLQQGETLRLAPVVLSLRDTLSFPPIPLVLKARHYLAVPVRGENGTLGYLICTHATRRLWTIQERELLQAVADQLAIAIIQSLLYTQTKEQVKLLGDALSELKRTQAYLVHTEKMSSLGQMVAGIAHEINNPISLIYGNLSYVNQYLEDLLKLVNLYRKGSPNLLAEINEFETEIDLNFIQEDLPQILSAMQKGAERIRQIIFSLRNFSRLDESELKVVDIHQGIDNTMLLINSRLNNQISVVKNYGKLPLVECYASQLNQVFINLFNNAIDALNASPKSEKVITITTAKLLYSSPPSIRVCIADNGCGIPPEIKPKIFDPFFTTKPVGSGKGLGLSISYQIVVELHGGQIHVNTPLTGGTEFVVEIPIQLKKNVSDPAQEFTLS
ncbi:MAG TPA: cache domain-containing protein [Waterburya sp.]|jgi:signal transduction histidine kinase